MNIMRSRFPSGPSGGKYSRFRIVVSAAFFLAAALSISGQAARGAENRPGAVRIRETGPVRRQFRERRSFIMLPGQERIDLERSFLIPGSDSVSVDGRLLERETDYRINVLRGTLILVRPAEGGQKVLVSWSRYPFPYPPLFASRFPGEKPVFPVMVPGAKAGGSGPAGDGNAYKLRLSGSKTVGFSIGSGRGVGIDQSLKVAMVGRLARDLEVKASLSDDNLPVQPEGNTEELRHLDKVYVQVNSRHMEARLGDFSTGLDWSRFSSFERELRGAAVDVEAGRQKFSAGGGLAQGRFKTSQLRGRDGVQGPYELLDARRFNGVIILPGTETVFLDGRQLRRGSENDYTIDYNRGTVTFTERIPVGFDSEIVVDYQMGEDDYERTTLTAGWSAPFASNAVRVKTFFFQEGDSPDQPLRRNITAADRSILQNAGDDKELAVSSGIEETLDAADAYIIVPADSVPAHFLFVETGGTHRVSFRQVGSGKGDYTTDGFTKRGEVRYSYAGPGRGSYATGVSLALPETRKVFTLGLEAEKGIFFVDAEGNVSLYDRNTLSRLDDADNDGGAALLEGGVRDLKLASCLLTLKGEYSVLEERFVSPGRTRESYFYRNWNLEDLPLSGREEISGASMRLKRETLWDIDGSFRKLTRGEGLTATRGEAGAKLGDASSRGISLRAFESRTADTRDRRYAELSGAYSFWRLVPRVSYDTERYRAFSAAADTGRYYQQGTIGVSSRRTGAFRADLSYSERTTDNMSPEGGIWTRARENDEIRFDGGYAGGSRIVDLFLSHRETREITSGGASRYDLARIRFRDSWGKAGLTNDIGYRISSGEDRRLEKAVIFVGENEGDYDGEGREVGQKRGDYMVLYLPASEVEAVRTVELTWRLSLGSGVRGIDSGQGRGGLFGIIKKNVSVDNFFSVEEKSSSGELMRLYLLDPSIMQRDDLTLYGKNSLRQEWSFLNDVRNFNLRFIFVREDEEDNRSQDISMSRYNREMQLKAEAAPGKSFTFEWDAGTSLRETRSEGSNAQEYRVESLSAAQILGYRLRPSTRISLETGFEKRNDGVSGAAQTSFMGAPSLNSSVGEKIHIASFLKFTYTAVGAGDGKPLFFLEEGLREDWSVIGQYRFSRNVSFSTNYNGRREKDYMGEVKTVHALKMECRASF